MMKASEVGHNSAKRTNRGVVSQQERAWQACDAAAQCVKSWHWEQQLTVFLKFVRLIILTCRAQIRPWLPTQPMWGNIMPLTLQGRFVLQILSKRRI